MTYVIEWSGYTLIRLKQVLSVLEHKTMIMKRVHKKTKVGARYKHVLEILKFDYALTSHFSSLSGILPLPLRFLLNKPKVKIKYK